MKSKEVVWRRHVVGVSESSGEISKENIIEILMCIYINEMTEHLICDLVFYC